MAENDQAFGIQSLIERLRAEGIEAGEARADQLLEEARLRAEAMLAEARDEADKTVQEARAEAEHCRAAGEDSVRLALRDSIISLKTELVDNFAKHLRRLVSYDLDDADCLRRLVLAVARQAAPPDDSGELEVLLPPSEIEPDDPGVPDEQGKVRSLVASLACEMLREGVEFKATDNDQVGIRVRLVGRDVEIDLTDQAVADLLLRRLIPRFRAMLEGS